MSKKIILFLSDYKEGAQERSYFCPDGEPVTGAQTNDAPVKYLLRAYPDVSELLCIVTEEARNKALEPFKEMVRSATPGKVIRVTEVPFSEGQDFIGEVLGMITTASSSKKKKKTEILLETTGGFRNAIMYLLLVSRALSYRDIHTVGAVYSNFKTNCVEDVSPLINLFDLVGGMQEMTNFGSVETLRKYYTRPSPEIDRLLSAMERLKEDITLCRTKQERLEKRINDFNAALEQAEESSDPLMRALLPAFQAKFDKKLSIPGLIKWCISSDMLQQALTIYKERIPAYILEQRPDILMVKPGQSAPQNKKEYESEAEARFFEQLLPMSRNLHMSDYDANWENGRWKDYTVRTLEHLEDTLPYSCFTTKCPVFRLRDILMDYLYIRLLRNMINHANDQAMPSQQQLMDYLVDAGYKRIDQVRLVDIKRVLENALKHLRG